MSNSKLVQVTVPAYKGNYTVGRSGRKIEAITIHHMAGVLSAESCGKIFQAADRYGSSHYGIGNDGKIALYVDECNTAWTNSNWDSNCKSVTIETSNSSMGGQWPISDSALNSLIKLVADIAKRNNLGTLVKGKNVTWHSMFTATNCPGAYLMSKLDYIIAEANKINNATPTPAPQPTSGNYLGSRGYFMLGDEHPNIGKIADFMYRTFPLYTDKRALGNYYGPYIKAAITEFQARAQAEGNYNDAIDGCVGPITLASLEKYGYKK